MFMNSFNVVHESITYYVNYNILELETLKINISKVLFMSLFFSIVRLFIDKKHFFAPI